MKPPPPGWPRISPSLFYEDAPELMEQYVQAFEKVWARKKELAAR